MATKSRPALFPNRSVSSQSSSLARRREPSSTPLCLPSFVLASMSSPHRIRADMVTRDAAEYIFAAAKAAIAAVFHDLCTLRKSFSDLIFSMHKMHSIHMDLKPSNILLDDDRAPKIADFGMLKLFCGHVKTNAHNNLRDIVKLAKEGTEIKIDYDVIRAEKYMSLLHHHEFDDTFSRLEPMALMSTLCEAYCISTKPKPELPKVVTVCEFSTKKGTGRRNELTENEPHLSDSDSLRAQHGIKERKPKTSTAWVVTTAAPHHATGNRDLLSGFVTEHDDQFVHAVDGVPMKVLARGAVVTDAVVLPDVWFVPGLAANLVSVNQLAELDYSVGFGCGKCCIRSAADGKIMGKAHLREGGLYALDFLKVPLAI